VTLRSWAKGLRRDIGSTKRPAGQAGGSRSGGRRVGILGAVKRGEPASMKDLIYIHWRKTRKTVYQKSYRAGSDRRAREREKETGRERSAGREGTKERGLHDGRNEIVRAWIIPPTSLCPRISALSLPISSLSLSLSLAFSFFLSSSSSFSASPVHSFFHIRRSAYSTSRKRHLTVKSRKEL